MMENSYKNFRLASRPDLASKIEVIYATSAVASNVVIPRELNMVYRESNEINGEKNCFEFYR